MSIHIEEVSLISLPVTDIVFWMYNKIYTVKLNLFN